MLQINRDEWKMLDSFSLPSPIYLLVTLAAVILKKEKPDSVATAFANRVFPVPSDNCRERGREKERVGEREREKGRQTERERERE